MNLGDIYKHHFIFKAVQSERCFVNKSTMLEDCNVTIQAIMKDNSIQFGLVGLLYGLMDRVFRLPVTTEAEDIFVDRIQYGRLPKNMYTLYPDSPVVCEIFNDMESIRFTMLCRGGTESFTFYGGFCDWRPELYDNEMAITVFHSNN